LQVIVEGQIRAWQRAALLLDCPGSEPREVDLSNDHHTEL
jgi:hypothetical protein